MTEPEETRSAAFREAAAAVDRFLGKFGEGGKGLVDAGQGAMNRLRAELGRVVDLNLDLVRNAFSVAGSLATDGDNSDSRVRLAPNLAGESSSSVVWVHNFDDTAKSAVRLIGSQLTSGTEAPRFGWSFEPSEVDVPPRSGVPVVVTVSIPEAAEVGTYEGVITATGLDGEPITVELEVVGSEPIPHDSW